VEELIERLVDGHEVALSDLKKRLGEICDGRDYSPEQLAAFLVLLRARGETPEQLAAIAETLLERAIPVDIPPGATSLVGTGGDHAGTFNISTAASLLVAACGVPVAKAGNRSITSQCGSADVLEALGIPLDLGPDQAAQCIREQGFVFLFAIEYHPAFKYVAPVRNALKVRTVFNIMGPLVHPGNLKRLVVGVFDRELLDNMAHVFLTFDHERTLVVSSADGLDEITLSGPTYAKKVEHGRVSDMIIDPTEFGFSLCSIEDLKGGDASENAAIIRDIFGGARGPKADCTVLNTGFGLYVSGKVNDPAEGIELARSVQQSGSALEFLDSLREDL
jgi:anthranilate phosphoribosyltransferase